MMRQKLMMIVGGLLLLTPALAPAADIVVPGEQIIPALNRISWSAVFAGAVVALATHMALSTLGFGIGVSAIDPQNRKHPVQGVPTTILVWMFFSGLVALFVGGWVSGRMAGTIPFDSAIHGVITWAFATVTIVILATTSLGYIVGGTFKLMGEAASSTMQAAASILPGAAKMAKDAIADNLPTMNWTAIQRDAKQLFAKGSEGGSSKEKDDMSDDDTQELLTSAYGVVRNGLEVPAQDEIVRMISSKTGVKPEEAKKTLDRWEAMYKDAKKKYEVLVDQADKAARDAAQVAKSAIGRIAVWTFVSLVFGVGIAALGGNLGSTYTGL
jgi:hypothetical protein